jgi:hypothetical protein
MKMKNKKVDQIAAKRKHLQSVAEKKAQRRKEPSLKRQLPSKIEKPTILIVCEGKNTEPSYFQQFKLSSATIKTIGNGYNTIALINQAIVLSQERLYDQVWCVFDKDQFPPANFNNAIQIAEANNFRVAYSNQSFEYWLILHFEDHQGGAMNRSEYESTINNYLQPFGLNYDGKGNKIISEAFFKILNGKDEKNRSRVLLALTRAERNYKKFGHENHAAKESSTTVFKLIREILKLI